MSELIIITACIQPRHHNQLRGFLRRSCWETQLMRSSVWGSAQSTGRWNCLQRDYGQASKAPSPKVINDCTSGVISAEHLRRLPGLQREVCSKDSSERWEAHRHNHMAIISSFFFFSAIPNYWKPESELREGSWTEDLFSAPADLDSR